MLEAHNITFGYQGAEPLFRDFNLTVKRGERVALSAPSGFGKTTMCRILAGYLHPTAGQVLMGGAPLRVRGACPVQLVMQHPELAVDPRSRMSDVLAEAGPADDALLERLGIAHAWLSRYPHELSGGELQRFCIARALIADPRFLIADEMTTMLDALTQASIWHALLDEADRRNLGIVFVSHSPALTSRIATRIVNLESR
ncbi:ATP-binding cassette domain-containing protein [Eggerthellaceae bacterium zg-887]|uniref:ABC transporter ATP-binding protein n=1 Tax=Xiamenia xianingshaonis TaxID=2682776 RepID=UPI0014079D95|nr:ATP-binding cassette domain-containing protein [Xiamenia xianingshaonis]NHM16603.1 ATP-binding cassette domain-containing protein [Xiamenia xianingshaonis]